MENRYYRNQESNQESNREDYRNRPEEVNPTYMGRDRYDQESELGYERDREEDYFRNRGRRRRSIGQSYMPNSPLERGYGPFTRRAYESDYLTNPYWDMGNRRDYGREYNRGNRYEEGDYSSRGMSGYPYGSYGRHRGDMGMGEQSDYGRQEDRSWWDKTTDEVSSWFGNEEAERRRQMDARQQGQHRGRGPRNYQRSDSRIQEDINDHLTDDAAIDASDVEVEVSNGDVILKGTVESRYEKRMAEDIAEDISGVKNVENHLRVQHHLGQNLSSTETSSGASASGTTTSQASGKNRNQMVSS